MNYLLSGGYNPQKLDLLIESTGLRSEDIIAAVSDHLIRGASIDVAAAMNLVDPANLNRAIKKLNVAAERFYRWNQLCLNSDSSKQVALVTEVKPKKAKFNALELVPSNINLAAWSEWVEFRSSKRKPVSKLAAKKQFDLLVKYPFEVQAEIINSSIQNDYQGLFEPKGYNNAIQSRHAKSSHAERSADDTRSLLAYADALEASYSAMGANEPALPQQMDSGRGISCGEWQSVTELQLVAEEDGTAIERGFCNRNVSL